MNLISPSEMSSALLWTTHCTEVFSPVQRDRASRAVESSLTPFQESRGRVGGHPTPCLKANLPQCPAHAQPALHSSSDLQGTAQPARVQTARGQLVG